MTQTSAIGARLSVMMFLQFFIWGAWYVSVGNYIGKVGWSADVADGAVGWAYTVGPIAAIVSPLFLGVIADRFFATQKVLAAAHLIGGAVMLAIPSLIVGPESSADLLVVLLLGHMLCYMPTLGLTNTLAFHHVVDQEKQFPVIRVFGTLGWIAANFTTSTWLKADFNPEQFYVAGIAAVALGLFSLSLPHTPPPLRGQKVRVGELLGLDAVALLKDRSFLVFTLASFLICIPLAGYYVWVPVYAGSVGYEEPASTMANGQIAEVVFMVLMPLFFARLGVKWMIAIGMLAWVVRYVLFAGAADDQVQWMVLSGILLHGICYDFFFVTGQIYVDKFAPGKIRGQAQGFLVLVTQGLGLGVGAQLFTELVTRNSETVAGVAGAPDVVTRDWGAIWMAPAIAAGVVLVLFVLLFRNPKEADAPTESA